MPRGFTLTELVVVMVLIGIITALAGPRFLDPDAFSRSSFFDETLNAARYSHQLAVTSGCHVRFQLNAGIGFELRRDANCAAIPALAPDFTAAGSQVDEPSSPGSAYASGSMPAGLSLSLSESSGALTGDTLIFSPDGRVRAPPANGTVLGEVTATLTDGSNSRSFFISGATGYVR